MKSKRMKNWRGWCIVRQDGTAIREVRRNAKYPQYWLEDCRVVRVEVREIIKD